MSVFESEHTAQMQLGHPHIAEFDEWLATADQDALAAALAQRASFNVLAKESTSDTESPMSPAFVSLNYDHLVAAAALKTAKNEPRREQVEVEITTKSRLIPTDLQPRRKREPHFKAWKPPQQHTPVLVPIQTKGEIEVMADACKDEDPMLFESKAARTIAIAKSICARCSTVTECRTRAIEDGNYEMTQGGMSATELQEYAKSLA